MARIVASANDSPTRISVVWIVVNGKRVFISKDASQPSEVPSGVELTIEWDFRGNPGDEATVEIYESVGQNWAKYEPPLKVVMPGGKTRVTSTNPPAGQQPYTLQT
ncbi:hypothetical protein [Ideonella sp. A 288]|uniref:hypothetical protein n=1 Tax=Ideonella sp. A 288 TaxID=1962181 RepID=UPI0011846F79|nr:hypothetical protein [Ideonella sp. A 288]